MQLNAVGLHFSKFCPVFHDFCSAHSSYRFSLENQSSAKVAGTEPIASRLLILSFSTFGQHDSNSRNGTQVPLTIQKCLLLT